MGVVNFNVSLRLSPIQRTFIQFENVSTEISITDLKNEIINKGGLEKSCELELIYGCQNLSRELNLAALDGGPCVKMIYATMAKPAKKLEEPKRLSPAEQQQLTYSFRSAVTNLQLQHTLQNLSKPETMKYLLDKVPGLSEDQVALSMLHDWELVGTLNLADPKFIQSLVESHPALVDSLYQLVINPPNELNIGEGYANMIRHRIQNGRLARSLGADLDDDGMEEDTPRQPATNQPPPSGINITPAHLAAALNFVQGNRMEPVAGHSATPRSSRSTRAPPAAVSQFPNTNNSLTPEMFSQALLHAMSSMGNPPNNTTATAAAAPSNPTNVIDNLRQQFGSLLPEMRELGIIDDSVSLRALQVSNGNIEAAINLIFSGLLDE